MNASAPIGKTNQTIATRGTKLVFRPRHSYGWAWLIAIAILALMTMVPAIQMSGQAALLPVLLTIGIQGAVALGGFVLAFWFPTMRYELGDQSLTLRYGSILEYHISFDQIKSIRRRNLGLTLWSSIRFPGIALFTVPTSDAGDVKMCATAAMKGILLIETTTAKYGITPIDEAGFVAAIRARIKE